MAHKTRPGRKPKPRISPQAFADAVRPLMDFARRRLIDDAFQQAALEVWRLAVRGDCAPTADAIVREVKRRAWSRKIDHVRAARGRYVFTDPDTGKKSVRVRKAMDSLDAKVGDSDAPFISLQVDPHSPDPAASVRFPNEAAAIGRIADEWRRNTSLIIPPNHDAMPSVRISLVPTKENKRP